MSDQGHDRGCRLIGTSVSDNVDSVGIADNVNNLDDSVNIG